MSCSYKRPLLDNGQSQSVYFPHYCYSVERLSIMRTRPLLPQSGANVKQERPLPLNVCLKIYVLVLADVKSQHQKILHWVSVFQSPMLFATYGRIETAWNDIIGTHSFQAMVHESSVPFIINDFWECPTSFYFALYCYKVEQMLIVSTRKTNILPPPKVFTLPTTATKWRLW